MQHKESPKPVVRTVYKPGQLVRLLQHQFECVAGVTRPNRSWDLYGLVAAARQPNSFAIRKVTDIGAQNDPMHRFLLLHRLQESSLTSDEVVTVAGEGLVHACNYCFKSDPAVHLQLCSKCLVAPYCGKDCQRQDWKRHKELECEQMSHFRSMTKIPLYEAATEGRLDDVRRLLQEGADVNKVTATGQFALMVASGLGNKAIVECLLQYKANVNQADAEGSSSLDLAARMGHKAVVELLVQHKADVNQVTVSGMSPLATAIEYGHLPIVQWLVKHGQAKLNMDSRIIKGYSPLLCAIYKCDLPCVKFLVEHGADIHVHSKEGKSTLYCAAGLDDLSTVKYLVEQGVAVNYREWVPLRVAIDNNFVEVVCFLSQHCGIDSAVFEGQAALTLAAIRDHLPMVKRLIKLGASVNKPDENGWAPIHGAAAFSSVPILQYLVEHKADLTKCVNGGMCPLKIASQNPNPIEAASYIRSQLK